MKKFFRFLPVAMIATAALTLTSCSDDDDNDDVAGSGSGNGTPTTTNVFSLNYPSSVDGATLTRNSDGQLTSIKEGSSTVVFEYGTFTPSRAHNYTVKMTISDTNYPDEGETIYMELNKQGFVTYAYEEYADDDDTDDWTFSYDSNGYLVKMVRSEGDETTTITWSGGNITKVNVVEDDGDTDEYTISYTNSTYSTPVENKGCIMLFDDTFGIDMDEMEFAYYAGLLGKASKNIPMSARCVSKEGHSTYTDDYNYVWEFNSNGLPTKFYEEEDKWDVMTFAW